MGPSCLRTCHGLTASCAAPLISCQPKTSPTPYHIVISYIISKTVIQNTSCIMYITYIYIYIHTISRTSHIYIYINIKYYTILYYIILYYIILYVYIYICIYIYIQIHIATFLSPLQKTPCWSPPGHDSRRSQWRCRWPPDPPENGRRQPAARFRWICCGWKIDGNLGKIHGFS